MTTFPSKITLLRLSAIGDVLMLLPAVRLLKKQFPETNIEWLIDRPIAGILSEVSEVTVIPIDKPKSIPDYWHFYKQWRSVNTGQLISFQTSFVSNIVMALLSADHKTGVGVPYSREGHHLFVNTAYDLSPRLHQVEIFFELAKKFSGLNKAIDITEEDLYLPINELDKKWAREKLLVSNHWIVINPMASTQEKTWPSEHYITLIDRLNQHYPDVKIVLTGGGGDQEIAFTKHIQAHVSISCLNLVGKTTLTQLAATLGRAMLVISPDTGPLHLANAVGTPIIGLYAVTRPEYIGPYHQLHACINLYDQVARTFMGKPSTALHWQKKIPSLEAMQLLTVEQVLSKVEVLFETL